MGTAIEHRCISSRYHGSEVSVARCNIRKYRKHLSSKLLGSPGYPRTPGAQPCCREHPLTNKRRKFHGVGRTKQGRLLTVRHMARETVHSEASALIHVEQRSKPFVSPVAASQERKMGGTSNAQILQNARTSLFTRPPAQSHSNLTVLR